jgi:hypothetical protein
MAFSQETDIVALLASFLEMPDVVRFRMCHQNGSIIIGLRRIQNRFCLRHVSYLKLVI